MLSMSCVWPHCTAMNHTGLQGISLVLGQLHVRILAGHVESKPSSKISEIDECGAFFITISFPESTGRSLRIGRHSVKSLIRSF